MTALDDPVVLAAVVAQIGTLGVAFVSARSARGAKHAATGAKNAATAAKVAGQSDHADQTETLDLIAATVHDIQRDVGGLRADDRQSRVEIHDLRQKLNKHLGLGD